MQLPWLVRWGFFWRCPSMLLISTDHECTLLRWPWLSIATLSFRWIWTKILVRRWRFVCRGGGHILVKRRLKILGGKRNLTSSMSWLFLMWTNCEWSSLSRSNPLSTNSVAWAMGMRTFSNCQVLCLSAVSKTSSQAHHSSIPNHW